MSFDRKVDVPLEFRISELLMAVKGTPATEMEAAVESKREAMRTQVQGLLNRERSQQQRKLLPR